MANIERPQIVFFGSGPVAAKSLELLSAHCDIEAVITKPQPPHHKEPFPVLIEADRLAVPIYTPVGKQALSELFAGPLKERPLQSRLGIVIDYGFIINQDVIDYFPLGIINSHFSLLPEWRGADPITFSILSGQKETGISLMLITAGMDEGPILAHAPFSIPDRMTTPDLTEALMYLSDATLQDILPAYTSGKLSGRPQESAALPHHTAVTYSRKLTKADSMLDFSKPADVLEREIRAFIEWPKSRTTLAGREVIIMEAYADQGNFGKPGNLDYDLDSSLLAIQCKTGNLRITRLKPAGKSEMDVRSFLAGYGQFLA